MINSVMPVYYILQLFLGIISGLFASIGIVRYRDEKKIFTKESFKDMSIYFPRGYIIITLNIIIYFALLYVYPIEFTTLSAIHLIKYMIITPLLLITFFVDLDIREIPDRVTLFLFEFAIIYIFLGGFININIAKDALMGSLVGGGVFVLLAFFGGLIAGREAMGMGDIKLMFPLGAIMGLNMTLNFILLSFILAAIISIIIVIIRKIKKIEDSYIPFGPFLVLSSIATMILPANYIVISFMKFSTYLAEGLIKLIV